jgi:hypothetical protein
LPIIEDGFLKELFDKGHFVMENSAKKQHGSKESGSKSEITDRNIYA